MSLWVVDSGPLIFLAKIQRLELLRGESRRVVAPETVMEETQAYDDDAARTVLAAAMDWLEVMRVSRRVRWPGVVGGLGSGEADVIVLARQLSADRVVIDDLAGRKAAHQAGLHVVGTIGFLLAARLSGELSSLRDEIDALRATGFWISAPLNEEVLRQASEWE